MAASKNIILGAGLFYVAPHTEGAINMSTVAVEDNLLGYTSGGATLTYTPTTKTIEDDCGYVRKTFQSSAEASIKTGLLTFDAETISRLISACSIDTSGDKKTLKLNGGKSVLKQMDVVFKYDGEDSTIMIGMVATNTSPLELAFNKENESTVDIEFSAESNGVDTPLITWEEPPKASA